MPWLWITPYILPDPGVLDPEARFRSPSVGLIHHISEDIVVKLNFQYLIPHEPFDQDEAIFRRDSGLRSFIGLRDEARFYNILNQHPHPHIVRSLHYEPGKGLFLKRAEKTLVSASTNADKPARFQWVRELLSALSWIESLGYIHGDIAVRNLLVDRAGRLQLCDFDQVRSLDEPAIEIVKESEHRALATCIHFILTGIDPTDHSISAIANERRLKSGSVRIEPAAALVHSIIDAGWLGHSITRTFAQVEAAVISSLGPSNAMVTFDSQDSGVLEMQTACKLWAMKAKIDTRWQEELKYRMTWKALGLDAEEGL
ncbi:MAG: hypothetical protein M1818_008200 [Claussenomyces sp. TS43310]|nr:MAG: hypothetical protein M1818_008200 [Claussenomyces sp. TS43310]